MIALLKHLFMLALSALIMVQSSAQGILPEPAKVVWDTMFYDFGTLRAGKVLEHSYRFINTGASVFIISDVRTSCGCVVSEWSRDTIASGGTGEIKVKFITATRVGRQLKVITVIANTEPRETILRLGGDLKAPKRKRRQKG